MPGLSSTEQERLCRTSRGIGRVYCSTRGERTSKISSRKIDGVRGGNRKVERDGASVIDRNARWNLVVNIVEGALFWVGNAFYSFQTVLPLFLSKLTDNPFALGWLATTGNSGWLLPQLFTARWVQRTPVKKDIVIKVGFFSERLPILVLAFIAWFVVPRSRTLALWLTLFTATWLAYGSGLIAIAWQSMVAKVIPQEVRGRFMGTASALGMAGGAAAAGVVTYILNTYAFPGNFARSFALGAVAGFLSWFFLSLTREPPDPLPPEEEHFSLRREIPRVLQEDPDFTRYLIARVFTVAGSMGTGFLAVYAVERWHLSDGQAGVFSGVSMAAQFVAYIFLGTWADKHGHVGVLRMGAWTTTLAFGVTAFAPHPHMGLPRVCRFRRVYGCVYRLGNDGCARICSP